MPEAFDFLSISEEPTGFRGSEPPRATGTGEEPCATLGGGQDREPTADLLCGPTRSILLPRETRVMSARQTQTPPRVPAVRVQHLCPRGVKKQSRGEGPVPGLWEGSRVHITHRTCAAGQLVLSLGLLPSKTKGGSWYRHARPHHSPPGCGLRLGASPAALGGVSTGRCRGGGQEAPAAPRITRTLAEAWRGGGGAGRGGREGGPSRCLQWPHTS